MGHPGAGSRVEGIPVQVEIALRHGRLKGRPEGFGPRSQEGAGRIRRITRRARWLVPVVGCILLLAAAPAAEGQTAGPITVNVLTPAVDAPAGHYPTVVASVRSGSSLQSSWPRSTTARCRRNPGRARHPALLPASRAQLSNRHGGDPASQVLLPGRRVPGEDRRLALPHLGGAGEPSCRPRRGRARALAVVVGRSRDVAIDPGVLRGKRPSSPCSAVDRPGHVWGTCRCRCPAPSSGRSSSAGVRPG